MSQNNIRNFAIIAHIDHGKSTLADRLMEMTGTVAKRDMQAQLLDSNPIERERGITIKLAPVRMTWKRVAEKGNDARFVSRQTSDDSDTSFVTKPDERIDSLYTLNLIDTPGHVDFSYEVSRSLAACEGAILLVDATQGVQAQTLSNLTKAREQKLTIIPVINKIDMPHARIEETSRELEALGFPLISPITPNSPILISAKTGQGITELLEAIVGRIPPPHGEPDKPLRALIFSSQYDSHKGVVVFVRIVDGFIALQEDLLQKASRQSIRFIASGVQVTPIEVGFFHPAMRSSAQLQTGEVGYIATGLKDARLARVGDTITLAKMPNDKCQISNEKQKLFSIGHLTFSIDPLPGYHDPQPMVFLGLFPMATDDLTISREAMERLRLSDAAFTFKPIHSAALGNGFHCGFLGLLHAEIVQERLLREFGLSMMATAPSVEYHLTLTGWNPAVGRQGSTLRIQSAAEFPDPSLIDETREPIMQVTIFTPSRFVGPVMQLAQEKRGALADHTYRGDQAQLTYLIPLSDLIIDFFDRLKSISEGYASLDYEFFEYQPTQLVKLDIFVNKEPVDALSTLVVAEQAQRRGRDVVERLAAAIPRQQFEAPVQAAIGGEIIARADIKAFRKDVTQKLYGGDRTRKDKLLDKQKKGKERMKMIGRVAIPQEAFFTVLRNS